MLSPEELAIIKDVAGQINQTAGYSYHVLVQGTAISGLLSLVTTVVWIALTLLVAKKIWSWADREEKLEAAKERPEGGMHYAIAIFGAVVIAIALWLLMSSIYVDACRVAVPEYYVIKTILAGVI